MAPKKFPIHPANPERLCWGCDRYCAAKDMLCGNGSDRTQHPFELFGEDWQSWGLQADQLRNEVELFSEIRRHCSQKQS